jgi:hypothetical protein
MTDAKVDGFRVSNRTRQFQPLNPPDIVPARPGNLIPNGDFRLGLAAGWRGRGYGDHRLCWTIQSGGVDGSPMLQSTPGTSELPVDLLSRPIAVALGRKYSWSAWLRASDQNAQVSFSLIGTGASNKFDGSRLASYSSKPGTGWYKASGEFTVPADFKCPSVAFLLTDPGNETQVSYDEFRLEDTTATDPDPLSELLGMSLIDPMPIGHTFVKGEAAILPFSIVNRDTSARHSVTVQALLTDWQGLPVQYTQPPAIFSVTSNSSNPTPFTLNTTSIGYFQLSFNYTVGGDTWSDLTFIRYAVVADMTMVGDASTSIFGMNTHMEREPSPHLKRNLGVLAKCGVKYIRAWWGWGMCEQVKGTFDFGEYERQYEAVTNGTGMLIMPILLRYYQSESFPWATWREAAWAGNTTCPKGNCSASCMCP